MQITDNLAVVEMLFQALRRFDIEGALDLMGDEVVYQNVPFPADRGKAQVRRTLRLFGKLFNHFDVVMKNIVEEDGLVLTERVDTLRGPLLDLSFWVCGTLRVQDGKIVLWRDYFDLGQLLLQVASSPARKLFLRR